MIDELIHAIDAILAAVGDASVDDRVRPSHPAARRPTPKLAVGPAESCTAPNSEIIGMGEVPTGPFERHPRPHDKN
jgi:hypothetical protein